MKIELEIDDIDLSRSDRLVADLFGMPSFSIAGDINQIEHLIKKYGIEVHETETTHGPLKWKAHVSDFTRPSEFGSSAIEAVVKVLLSRVFTDSSAIISFDLVFESATPKAAMEIITSGSPYHVACPTEENCTLFPDGDTFDDVEAFQIIVRRVMELSELGYIQEVLDHVSNDVGTDMIDYVSFKGRRLGCSEAQSQHHAILGR